MGLLPKGDVSSVKENYMTLMECPTRNGTGKEDGVDHSERGV